MKRIHYWAALFVLSSVSPVISQEIAVVEINSFLPSGSVLQGTGFFFREDASILTAYHVIEGARAITVLLQNEAGTHSDVTVEFISTKYDIAMIFLPSLKKSVGYLPLAGSQDIPHENEPLKVIGYPRMGIQQRFRGYTTSTNFIKSDTWFDKAGNQIFNENIDVIPIDLSNYVGMSGAPVVSSRGVIGLFSGSYSEGGALGWLIPRKYFGSLSKIHKRPQDIHSWPALTLMSKQFKDLRRSLSLNPHASALIRSYLMQVEALSDAYDRLRTNAVELKASTDVMRMIIATIPPSKPTIEPLKPMSDMVSNNLGAFMKANFSLSEIYNDIMRKMYDVANWFDKESGLKLVKQHRLIKSLDQVSSRYSDVVSQDFYSTIGATQDGMQQLVLASKMMFDANTNAEKLSAVSNFINVIDQQMPLYYSTQAIVYASQDISRHRSYGKIFLETAN